VADRAQDPDLGRQGVLGPFDGRATAAQSGLLRSGRVWPDVADRAGPSRDARAAREGGAGGEAAGAAPQPPEQWIEITVPAIVSEECYEQAARRFEENRRFSARNTRTPSVLQGLVACRRCGYALFRAPKRERGERRYVYYRCAGTQSARKHRGGRVCSNRPVRQDHLDALVWEHVVRLLSDPALLRQEITRRLEEQRQRPAATAQRAQLQRELGRITGAIQRLLVAYEEELLSLDELRRRLPELRCRESVVHGAIESMDLRLADEAACLKLAETFDRFRARLQQAAATASVLDRQQIVRLVVREVLVDTDAVIIRHTIPGLDPGGRPTCHLRGPRARRDPSARHGRGDPGVPRAAGPPAAGGARAPRGAGAVRSRYGLVPRLRPGLAARGVYRDLVAAGLRSVHRAGSAR